jgi:hypothetical protein
VLCCCFTFYRTLQSCLFLENLLSHIDTGVDERKILRGILKESGEVCTLDLFSYSTELSRAFVNTVMSLKVHKGR